MPFHSVTNLDHNEEAIAKDATSTTGWKPAKGAEGFNFWLYMESTASPSVTWTLETTLVAPGYRPDEDNIGSDGLHILDPDSTVRNNYRSIEIVAAETTQDAWQHYNTPDELKYPFSHYRSKIVEGDVGAVDLISTEISFNGMR